MERLFERIAQHRDASAIQAKLDELIRAHKPARNDFIGVEHPPSSNWRRSRRCRRRNEATTPRTTSRSPG